MPLPQPTSLRDRTPEFLLLCERLQRAQPPVTSSGAIASTSGSAAAQSGPGRPDLKAQITGSSEFARKAAEIGHGIHRTSLKLQKLAQLAKRTSMFDDPAQEVDELTGIIKQDIQALNANIAELQRLGTAKQGETASKQSSDHSHTVVDSLRTRLKDATQEFKDVLTVRTESLKHHKERRQLFSDTTDADATIPLLRQRPMHPASSSAAATTSNGVSGGQSNPHTSITMPSFLAGSAQQQLQISQPAQDTYMSSRAEALRNVESTIVELGTIFNKLSEMVASQTEMAVRIDENIDETLGNVQSAQEQLLKYLNTISNNRWLVLKVFAVLLVFLFVFIMFIA